MPRAFFVAARFAPSRVVALALTQRFGSVASAKTSVAATKYVVIFLSDHEACSVVKPKEDERTHTDGVRPGQLFDLAIWWPIEWLAQDPQIYRVVKVP